MIGRSAYASNVSLANSATYLAVRSAASSALKMMLTSSMGGGNLSGVKLPCMSEFTRP